METIEKALKILNEEGLEKYSSKLSETECFRKEKKFFGFLSKSKKYEITEDFARQVIYRKKLNLYIDLLTNYGKNVHNFNKEEKETYLLIAKTLVNFNNIFKTKKDNKSTNVLLSKTFPLIKQSLELGNYGTVCDIYAKSKTTHIQIKNINPLLNDEKNILKNIHQTTKYILEKETLKEVNGNER